MEDEKISIITITYNRGHYLPETIESILGQTYGNWELIIIDDASEDNTEEIIANYCAKDKRIKYFKNSLNIGPSKSRNKGLELSIGKYIAVLDSDDVWPDKDKLQKQLDYLKKNKEYILLGSAVIVIDGDGNEIRRYKNSTSDQEIRRKILLRNPFLHSSVLFVREMAVKAGGYDEDVVIGEEYSLWLRMGKLGKMSNSGEYLVSYRVHGKGACVIDRIGGALDTKTIIVNYHYDYPNYFLAMVKAYLRIVYSLYLTGRDWINYRVAKKA